MLKELPAKKFLEWYAFDLIEPIGGKRGDWQAASVSATVLNAAALSRGVRAPRVKPADMILEYGKEGKPEDEKPPEPPQKSWQQMKFIARMWVADSKAKEKKKR